MTQTVAITSPAAGSTVKGVTTIKVTATGVSTVNFYIDGVLKGKDQAAPFKFDWYTTRYNDGTHAVKVTSDNGKVSDVKSFVVANAVPVPTPVGFSTSLVENDEFTLPYSWTFDPGEAAPTTAGYFWGDGHLLQKITGSPPYNFALTNLPPGPHQLGHAWDSADGSHHSPPSAYDVIVKGLTISLTEANKSITASILCR